MLVSVLVHGLCLCLHAVLGRLLAYLFLTSLLISTAISVYLDMYQQPYVCSSTWIANNVRTYAHFIANSTCTYLYV